LGYNNSRLSNTQKCHEEVTSMQRPALLRGASKFDGGVTPVERSVVPSSGAAARGSDPKKEDGDEKFVVVQAGALEAPKSALASMGVSLRETKTRLAIYGTSTSTANTANTTVIPVEPANSSEFSALSGLFAECKVHGGRLHYTVSASAGNVAQFSVFAFDPMNSTALSGVANGVEYSQFDLRGLNPDTALASPTPVAQKGYYTFHFKVLKGSARSSSAATVFQSEWSATTDASDTYGFLKPYVPALGAGVTTTIVYVLELDISFRSRY